jgi:ADP-heptose:LPS heptosyltransferase
MKVLFSKTDSLGDQLLATGPVSALLKRRPEACVIWIVRQGYESIGSLLDGSQVFRVDPTASAVGAAARLNGVCHSLPEGGPLWSRVIFVPIRPEPYLNPSDECCADIRWLTDFVARLGVDFAIAGTVTLNWVDYVLTLATRASQRIGYLPGIDSLPPEQITAALENVESRGAFTVVLECHEEHHESDNLARLMDPIMGETWNSHLPLESVERPKESGECRTVILAPGAGAPGRIYPVDRLADAVGELVRDGILKEDDLRILRGPKDGEVCERLRGELQNRGIIARTLEGLSADLRKIFEIFAESRLLICNETFWVHLASVAGTPTVAIWGLGHWGRFLPRQGRITVLHTEMICERCNWRCCFSDTQCVASIPVSGLVEAIKNRLESRDTGILMHAVPKGVSSKQIRLALRAQLEETMTACREKERKIISLMTVNQRRSLLLEEKKEDNRRMAKALQAAENLAAAYRRKHDDARERAEALEGRYWQERQKPFRQHLLEAVFGKKS